MDSFGFKKHAKEGSNKFVFQDNGLAESYLATQASLQDETNRSAGTPSNLNQEIKSHLKYTRDEILEDLDLSCFLPFECPS